jgi:hypothetical protein
VAEETIDIEERGATSQLLPLLSSTHEKGTVFLLPITINQSD